MEARVLCRREMKQEVKLRSKDRNPVSGTVSFGHLARMVVLGRRRKVECVEFGI